MSYEAADWSPIIAERGGTSDEHVEGIFEDILSLVGVLREAGLLGDFAEYIVREGGSKVILDLDKLVLKIQWNFIHD